MASNKHFDKSRSNLSNNSDIQEPGRPPAGHSVKFAQRTSSGRYINYSRDDLDSELGGQDFMSYTVHIPPTPDNQPMDPSISQKVEEQYVANSMFTGGFKSNTRAHLMHKVIETEPNHPQMAGSKGSSCAIPGCDAKVMSDERGQDLLPCECDFKICRDCFIDAVKTGGGICPGCKEPYKNTHLTDQVDENGQQRPMLPGGGGSKMERRLSMVKSTNKSALMRSQTGDFDHNRWLFETTGTYGYGNAFWTKDGDFGSGKDGDGDGDGMGMEAQDLMSRPWRPLTRKLKIPAGVISPYRLLIFIRIVVLALFLTWRVKHQNPDAVWLWGMSVVCELWFALSWLLDQLPKLCPINRATDLQVLKEKFETPTASNPTGKSDLPGFDVFVSTADPEKEPPLVTANTILSILAAEYPVEKLSCYVSDDGGALLTFEAMAEAASFANICREVMWPRLVANKILRKSLGSNNFVADFPPNTDQKLIEASGLADERSKSILHNQHKTTLLNYKVFVSTWNVGGIVPDDGLDMEDLLETHKTPCDIYVLGFQEVVPLRASNVLGSDNNKVSTKWNSLIRDALNKRARPHRDEDLSESKGINGISQDFRCIISKQMVGILITVWVRGDLWPYIRYPSVSCVGCGIMGCLGNKGSVSVRFQLHETTFCFVCSHLASGGRDRDERQRNSDVNEILARSSFPRGSSLDLPKKILDHDRVIFLGDLNYRISLPEEKTRLLVESKKWNILLENDQLRMEIMNGQIFRGWQEGIVKFAPTYKYVPNSDLYYGCITYKKDEKKRAPAWCDRIIWYGNGLKQHEYTRGETKISDHRPVKAIFTTEITVTRRGKKIRNFFFSDRFEERIGDIDSKDYSWIST